MKNKKNSIIKNKKLNKKNIIRFRKDQKCSCLIHGSHNDFRSTKSTSSAGIVHEYIKCLICERERGRKMRKKNPLSFMHAERKYHSKKNNKKFELTFNDILDIYSRQNGKCALTNITFGYVLNKPSIDRIDSKKGYLRQNCQLVIYDVNRMKSDLPLKEFKYQCNLVSKFN